MNKKFFTFIVSCGSLSSTFAQSNENHFYSELKGGLVFPAKQGETEFKTGFGVGGELGYAYKNIRFGIGLDYSQFKTKDYQQAHNECRTLLGTINVYYDYALNDNFKLYTGAGLGIWKWEAREKLQNRTEPWEPIN